MAQPRSMGASTASAPPATATAPSGCHAPPAPGAYVLRMPAPAFGRAASGKGGLGVGGVFPVVTPMPGKVVKVLVALGAWALALVPRSSYIAGPSPPAYPCTHAHAPPPLQLQATLWRRGSPCSSWRP